MGRGYNRPISPTTEGHMGHVPGIEDVNKEWKTTYERENGA